MTTKRHIARASGSTSTAASAFRVELRSGAHVLVADEPTASGGHDAGPTPFGLVLSGLTACTAMTLRMYADRKGWALTTLEVEASYDVDDDGHATIDRVVTVPIDLPEDQRERLAEIAEKTPVTLAVRNGTPIRTSVRRAS